jgi:hypothetical protein
MNNVQTAIAAIRNMTNDEINHSVLFVCVGEEELCFLSGGVF